MKRIIIWIIGFISIGLVAWAAVVPSVSNVPVTIIDWEYSRFQKAYDSFENWDYYTSIVYYIKYLKYKSPNDPNYMTAFGNLMLAYARYWSSFFAKDKRYETIDVYTTALETSKFFKVNTISDRSTFDITYNLWAAPSE